MTKNPENEDDEDLGESGVIVRSKSNVRDNNEPMIEAGEDSSESSDDSGPDVELLEMNSDDSDEPIEHFQLRVEETPRLVERPRGEPERPAVLSKAETKPRFNFIHDYLARYPTKTYN